MSLSCSDTALEIWVQSEARQVPVLLLLGDGTPPCFSVVFLRREWLVPRSVVKSVFVPLFVFVLVPLCASPTRTHTLTCL